MDLERTRVYYYVRNMLSTKICLETRTTSSRGISASKGNALAVGYEPGRGGSVKSISILERMRFK